MKQFKTIQSPLTLVALTLWVAGCATPNVNPPQPAANTGYVDFRADLSLELCWEVSRFDDGSQSYKDVFSKLEPPSGGVLRLAFAPGRHRLQITFLNRVVTQPAEVQVEVHDGKITPVRVTLTEAGTAQVRTVEQNRGGTARGGYGRRTLIGSDDSTMYSLSAVAEAPMPYQVKERISYAP